MISKRLLLSMFGVLMMVFGSARAQDGIGKAATSPFKQQMVVEFKSGAVAIADNVTQRIYITTKSGRNFEVPFADAVASAEPNVSKRSKVLSEFRSSLTDSGNMVAIRTARVATDATLWPRDVEWCGAVICINPLSTTFKSIDSISGQGMAYTQSPDCNHYLCPDLPLPCDMGPCSPNKWSTGREIGRASCRERV